MKQRTTLRLDPLWNARLNEYADRRGLTRAAVMEAAIASFLSPDAADRREAAFARRLDRLARKLESVERKVTVSAEAQALFVHFWLTVTPPQPEAAQAAARARGQERYEGFIETLGRRLAQGRTLDQELSVEVPARVNSEGDP